MRLAEEQVERYFEDGFLVVEDVFTDEELAPVLDDFADMVDVWANKLHESGRIADRHEGEDVYTRLASLEREWPNAAALIHWREGMRPALSRLWSSPKLLDMVEQFIGPDIVGHPVSVIRTKTPDTALMTVPWHQDSAYFEEGGEGTLQPTAWIPFVDVTAENGTLEVIRGSHRSGEVFPHHIEKDVGHEKSWYLYVKDENLPGGDVVTCEMKRGSVLWHGNMMVHRSTENHSDKVRWTCDLRYQRPGSRRACRRGPSCRRCASPMTRTFDWTGRPGPRPRRKSRPCRCSGACRPTSSSSRRPAPPGSCAGRSTGRAPRRGSDSGTRTGPRAAADRLRRGRPGRPRGPGRASAQAASSQYFRQRTSHGESSEEYSKLSSVSRR